MADRTKLVAGLYTAAAVAALWMWWQRSGVVWLALAIPCAWLVLWLLNRRRVVPASRALRLYLAAAKLVLVLAWLPALLLAAVLVVLEQPWPFSLRQGPDTEYARDAFERVFHVPPSEAITELYVREEWGFGGDGIESVRFRFGDENVLTRIIADHRLQPVSASEIGGLRVLEGPAWWPERALLAALPEAYVQGGVDHLWIDRADATAYFQRARF